MIKCLRWTSAHKYSYSHLYNAFSILLGLLRTSLKVLNESLTAQFAAVDLIQHGDKAAVTYVSELDSRVELIKLLEV